MANYAQAVGRRRQAFLLGWPMTNLGGVNEVIRNLMREFESSGELAPLAIETLPARPGDQRDGVLQFPLPAPYDCRHPSKALFAFLLRLPVLLWRLRRLCTRYDVAVLNPHFVGLEYFALMVFRRSGLFRGKLVLSLHGSDLRNLMKSTGFPRLLARTLLRGADALVPCSEGLGEEVGLFVPDCSRKIRPIPNGIDIQRFICGADLDFQVPEAFLGRRFILNVGAFEHKKGHDVLLRAFAEVRRSRPGICLIIAGQTAGKLEATDRLIDDLGLEEDVLLLRDIPHNRVAALLKLCDLFVLSSRWEMGVCGEGFAIALLEAAAFQKPVVTTRSCGVEELVRDGESGLVVDTERPDLLAKAIERFLDHPEDAARQGRKLHETVRDRFTWRSAHSRYLELAREAGKTAARTTGGAIAGKSTGRAAGI